MSQSGTNPIFEVVDHILAELPLRFFEGCSLEVSCAWYYMYGIDREFDIREMLRAQPHIDSRKSPDQVTSAVHAWLAVRRPHAATPDDDGLPMASGV